MLYYSKTTRGFYDSSIHTPGQIPSDAVALTAAEYRSVLEAQSRGKVIEPDDNGKPVAVDPPPLSAERLSALLKRQALDVLSHSDITILRCVERGVTVPGEWVTYRQKLREIVSTGTGEIPAQPEYPAGT
jgi:hypothetical protein